MNTLELEKITRKLIYTIESKMSQWVPHSKHFQITEQTDIRNDLEFDSLVLVVMQIELEDAFQIRFDTTREDFQAAFSTIRTLSECIMKHIEEKYNGCQ